jgi:hypothetical protein
MALDLQKEMKDGITHQSKNQSDQKETKIP